VLVSTLFTLSSYSTNTMNNRFRYPTWLIMASAVAPLLSGQAVTPEAAPSATPPEETILLSPFLVSSERDTGYQAQSTLAGTRLNTPLRDLGASISVYTRDFLADIGATNINDLLVFATGMEAGGAGGNFSGTNTSIGETQVIGDNVRVNPQGSSRSRGLNAPSYTRGYFPTNIAMDGYNTGAVTVNRGPNSILFGIGSPSGVVDTALLTANVARNNNRIEHRLGDTGSSRAILDINRVLIPRVLAVRLIGLIDEERYQQKPAFEDKTRLFGTANYRPFRSTSISGSFETGKTRANRPITVMPFDSINPFWVAAGMPMYDWTFFDDPARNPNAAAQNAGAAANRPVGIGQAQIFGAVVIPYPNREGPNGWITGPTTSFRSVVNSNTSLTNPAANTLRPSLLHPTANLDRANDTIQFVETFNIGEGGIPAALFPGGVRPPGLKMQSFTNYDAFPFHKRQIDETSRQGDDFRTFNLNLSQTAWADNSGIDRVGIELTYNYEYYDRYSNNAFFQQGNGNHIRIDPNVSLPDGRPNPNVGRPYASGTAAAQINYFEAERQNARATAFVRYDFRDIFPTVGQWLGRHTITGLYEEARNNQITASTRYRLFGEVADAINPSETSFNRLPNAFVYVGPSILDGPLRLEPIRILPLQNGVITTRWFKAPAGLVNGVLTQGDFVETATTITESINDVRPTANLVKSKAVVLHSYWLKEHLVTTAGWRSDDDYTTIFSTRSYTSNPANFPAEQRARISNIGGPDKERARIRLSEYNMPSKPNYNTGSSTTSFSAVLRWPQELVRLPAGTDLSVFYSQSENFNPVAGRQTAELVSIDFPKGETEEFGIGASFFHDRLNLRLTRFETSQVNAGRGGTYGSAVNNFYRQLATFWAGQENIQSEITGQFYSRRADIEKLLNTNPALKAALNPRYVVSPTTGNVALEFDNSPIFSDTQDFVSKGTELEIIYNPTRQWRMAFNFAQAETTLSNLAPGARSVIEKLIPVWNEFRDTPRAGSAVWAGPGSVFPSTDPEHLGTQVQRDVLVPYYTLIAQEGVVSAEQRKYRANLVTNYTFGRDGLLRGFGVGTGVRWQSKMALGYPSSFRPDGSVFIDIENPYWSDDDINVDAWVSYGRRIYNDRINWRVQLNFRNLIGSSDPIAMTVQPDGSPAAMRLPPERRIFLTNTFEF
jgi:hypothetical protein